ncbi:MAG: tRNA uridine-5-carboxymethylaminomethyl(34) synthesis GTPase MnmE [Calditrichia bacterium]
MEEPIIAIATGNNHAALGIIRLSGENVLQIVNPFLSAPLRKSDDHIVRFRKIIHQGKELDHGIVTYFKAPHSFTGEDSVEIILHGNYLNLQRIVEVIISNSPCRPAEPGEFTKRAFMNQKIDLTQAEAISEFIAAGNKRAMEISLRHLEGDVRQFLKRVRQELLEAASLLEVELDFSEEDLEFVDREQLHDKIHRTKSLLEKAHTSFKAGEMISRGIQIGIIGKPNCGKSSLLNALLGKERAIVSDIPGTTRDYLDASMEMNGLEVRFIDTAGIRSGQDKIEQIGIERTGEIIRKSDLIIALFDASSGLDQDDLKILKILSNDVPQPIIPVINKTDLTDPEPLKKELISRFNEDELISISAKKRINLDVLTNTIYNAIQNQLAVTSEELVITSVRQANLIFQTIGKLNAVESAIQSGFTSEIIAFDLREALDVIGQITGDITSEEILNNIFSSFCIGK